MQAAGGEALFAKVNVADGAAVAEAVGRAWSPGGAAIDVLVNNAGIVRDAQLVKSRTAPCVSTMTDDAWDAVIGVNLQGRLPLHPRRGAAHDRGRRRRDPVDASSVVGLYGNFGQTNYAATKGGLITMTRTWARELGKFKIRVNAVAPGLHRHRDPRGDAREGARGDGGAHADRPHGASPRTSPTPTSGSPPTRRRSSTAR